MSTQVHYQLGFRSQAGNIHRYDKQYDTEEAARETADKWGAGTLIVKVTVEEVQ